MSVPNSPSPGHFNLVAPPKLRVPSGQSVESRLSVSNSNDYDEPISPGLYTPEIVLPLTQTNTKDTANTVNTIKVDVSCHRPSEDMSATDDGPLFRATMKALEQKTGSMRQRMKRVLKAAERAHQSQLESNAATSDFMTALREASTSNRNAVQPALEHYFNKIAQEILEYEKQNGQNLQKIIIDPLSKLYQFDIKQAESKKRDFEEESKDYYAYVSRYLGQRQDSLKEKKRIESDSKYQSKRKTFELKRFDYSSFMQDLHGGRKEQEVLFCLTKYADAQTKSYLEAAKKVEGLRPQLEALSNEVTEAEKEFQYQRREREEKRRNLEKSNVTYVEPDTIPSIVGTNGVSNAYVSDSDIGRSDSTASTLRQGSISGALTAGTASNNLLGGTSRSPGSLHANPAMGTSPGQESKFKGIRDLEDNNHNQPEKSSTQRKEGLLWALSKPGSHVDPKGLNKQAWHKYCVLQTENL